MNGKFKHLLEACFAICLILVSLVPGCTLQEQVDTSGNVETQPGALVENQSDESPCGCGGGVPAAASGGSWGLAGNLEISHAPRVNQTAKLSWCIRATETWTELKAWVQFRYESGKISGLLALPMSKVYDEIMVDGQLEFEGSLAEGEERHFDAVIKFPEEGNWDLSIYFLGKTVYRDRTDGLDGGHPYFIYDVDQLHITDDYAQFGFPEDHSHGCGIKGPNEFMPFTGFVDTDKPPPLNEPVVFTWGVGSISDVPDVSMRLEFRYLEGYHRITVPLEEMVVSGITSTAMDFMGKNEQIETILSERHSWRPQETSWRERLVEEISPKYTAVVSFPSEGDWVVEVWASTFDIQGREVGVGCCYLCFNVSRDKSIWGWKEIH